MPSVVLQPTPFIDSRSGTVAGSPRRFFVILTVAFRDRRPEVRWPQQTPLGFFMSRGESRKRGRRGQKSRCHRHRTRPHGVDGCERGYCAVTTPLGDLARDFPHFPLVRYPHRRNSSASGTRLPEQDRDAAILLRGVVAAEA